MSRSTSMARKSAVKGTIDGHTDVVKYVRATEAQVPGAATSGAGSSGLPEQGWSERGTRARVARLILELGPSSAVSLGDRLGLTPAAIRRHLDSLLAKGMIETRVARCAVSPWRSFSRGAPRLVRPPPR